MAATGTQEDAKTEDLNAIFKSLGERGKEGEKWKEYTESVSSYVLQQLSEFLNEKSANRIMFRPYGSAAEDLKCLEPDDVGDVDIMIFPTSDNLTIHDDLIEYLPEHPMQVRIKGDGHPVLQSCLVEDTEYVATSALKNFHPAIYGSASHRIMDFMSRTFKLMSREEFSSVLQCTWQVAKDTTGPAHALKYAQSFGSITEQSERLKDQQNLPKLDANFMEFFAQYLCTARGTEYTREHAEVLNDVLDLAKDIEISLNKRGLYGDPQMLPVVLQELLSSDRGKNIQHRIRDIESRSRNESGRGENHSAEADLLNNDVQCVRPDCCHKNESGSEENHLEETASPNNDQQCITPNNCRENEGVSGANHSAEAALPNDDQQCVMSDNCHKGDSGRSEDSKKGPLSSSEGSSVTPENADFRRKSDEESESVSKQSNMSDPLENSDQFSAKTPTAKQVTEVRQDAIDKREKKHNAQTSENQDESKADGRPSAKKEEFLRNPDNNKEDERWFEHLFGTVTESNETKFEDTEKSYERVGGIDFVPAFRSLGWPKVARDWIKRERKWPSPDMVDRVVQEGFHLVVKPPKNDGNPDCDFRISFSHAEYLLSQEMNDIQRECYRSLKKFYRVYLSTEPKSLVTFHLKNLLLQTIEETGVEMWTESNRAECMMTLLRNLVQALKKKDLRHFFVRSYNLFCIDYIESHEILESLAENAEKILNDPIHFAKEVIEKQGSTEVNKGEHVPREESTPSEKAATGQEMGEMSPTQREQELLTASALKTKETHQGSSYRYHDMKDTFLAISKELTDIALNDSDCSLEDLDPLERSLVEDLREIRRNHNTTVEEFSRMFGVGWDAVYMKVLLSTERNTRRRMLDGIQSVVEMIKYIVKQDDFGAGNEEAIARRMVHPDPTVDDPFDMSHVLPADSGTQLCLRFFKSLEPSPPQGIDMDGIPLD